MTGGAAPSTNKIWGEMCVCVCAVKRETEEELSSSRAPCRGAMALHIKSLVESFIRDRLLVCVHSLFFFFVLLFVISSIGGLHVWIGSLPIFRLVSFFCVFFYFVCAFFNTGSDKVALQDLIVKKHTALSSPFPFLSSFLAIER